MLETIQQTDAFKGLDPITQKVINKREVRTQIEDAVILARNIGVEKWNKITPLTSKYRKIVVEIVA